jgi:hypothetical protein
MSCCHIKQLLKELDYCKSGMTVWGRDYDLSQHYYLIRHQVKEYFPMNGVPQNIIDSLELLKGRIELAEQQLALTVDTIIHQIEKDLPC